MPNSGFGPQLITHRLGRDEGRILVFPGGRDRSCRNQGVASGGRPSRCLTCPVGVDGRENVAVAEHADVDRQVVLGVRERGEVATCRPPAGARVTSL